MVTEPQGSKLPALPFPLFFIPFPICSPVVWGLELRPNIMCCFDIQGRRGRSWMACWYVSLPLCSPGPEALTPLSWDYALSYPSLWSWLQFPASPRFVQTSSPHPLGATLALVTTKPASHSLWVFTLLPGTLDSGAPCLEWCPPPQAVSVCDREAAVDDIHPVLYVVSYFCPSL